SRRIADAFVELINLLDGRLDVAGIRSEVRQSGSWKLDLRRKFLVKKKDAFRIRHVHREVQRDVVSAHSHSRRSQQFRRPDAHQLDRAVARLRFKFDVINRNQIGGGLARLVKTETPEQRMYIRKAMVKPQHEEILCRPLAYGRAQQT